MLSNQKQTKAIKKATLSNLVYCGLRKMNNKSRVVQSWLWYREMRKSGADLKRKIVNLIVPIVRMIP